MEEDLPAPKPVEIFGYSGLLERAATPVMLGAGEEQYGQQQERDNGTTTTETVDPVLASLTSRIDVALGRTQQETDSSVIAVRHVNLGDFVMSLRSFGSWKNCF